MIEVKETVYFENTNEEAVVTTYIDEKDDVFEAPYELSIPDGVYSEKELNELIVMLRKAKNVRKTGTV